MPLGSILQSQLRLVPSGLINDGFVLPVIDFALVIDLANVNGFLSMLLIGPRVRGMPPTRRPSLRFRLRLRTWFRGAILRQAHNGHAAGIEIK